LKINSYYIKMVDKNEDFKNENKKMGELMNAVLGKREF